MEKSKEVMFTALMLREALGSNLYQDKIFCGNSTTIGESTIIEVLYTNGRRNHHIQWLYHLPDQIIHKSSCLQQKFESYSNFTFNRIKPWSRSGSPPRFLAVTSQNVMSTK